MKALLEIKKKKLFPSASQNVFRESEERVQEFRISFVDVVRSEVDQPRLVVLHHRVGHRPRPGVLREGRDQEWIAQNPFGNRVDKLNTKKCNI